MKTIKTVVICCAGLLVAGCGRNATAPGKNQTAEYGSATDIIPPHSPNLPTNQNNRADIGVGGAPSQQSGDYKTTPGAPANSDSELAKQIKVALTTGSMGTTGAIPENELTGIDVQVQNGVVTLSGPVSSEKESQAIQKRIAGFQGVKQVRNNLTIGARAVRPKPLDSYVPRSPGNEDLKPSASPGSQPR